MSRSTVPSATRPARGALRTPRRRVARSLFPASLAVFLLLLVLPVPAFASAQDNAPTLVVPFENTKRLSRTYWVSEAAAILLTDRLDAAGMPVVSRDERLRAFERLGVPATAPLTDATIIKIAQLVAADSVVLGSFTAEDDELSVRARRITLATGRVEKEIEESGPLTEIVAVFERVASKIGDFPESTEARGEGRPVLAAFEPYVKGLLAETPAGQVKYLVTALAIDPTYHVARIALWQAYTAASDHERALKTVLSVPEESAVARRARFLAALSELRLGRYKEATERLESLRAGHEDAAVLNNLGVINLRRGKGQAGASARSFFEKALAADPDDPDYRFNLGYAAYLARDLPAAIDSLREAVRRNPSDGEAHYVLGTVLLWSGAEAEGTRERDLALRLSSVYEEWGKRPATEPVPPNLERVKEDLEPSRLLRSEQAFVVTEQRGQQELASFHLERGRRFYSQERDREAEEELRRSLYLRPYQAEAHLMLGRIYLRTGRVREAIDTLKISLWSEETVAGHIALAEAYLQAGEPENALKEAERALVLDPESAEAKKLIEKIRDQDREG